MKFLGQIRRVAVALALTMLVVAADARAQRRLDEAGYREAVRALRASEPDARMAAVESIGHGGWQFRREAVTHLRRLLRDDPDWRVRASAGRAIGRLSLREALPDLVRALRDRDVEVRIVAASTLVRLPDAAAVPALVDLLSDEHPMARQWAAAALGVTRDMRATEPLLAALRDTTPAVRVEALRSLTRVADPEALPGLVEFITRDTHPDDQRHEAFQAIAALPGPEKVDALLRLLDQSDSNLRLHAARALGQVGQPAQLPALRARRQSETEARVRTRIDEAISAIGQRERGESDE